MCTVVYIEPYFRPVARSGNGCVENNKCDLTSGSHTGSGLPYTKGVWGRGGGVLSAFCTFYL